MSDNSPAQTDGALIAAVLSGEKDRFAELVGRYQNSLLKAARSRLGRDNWAEDAVQEAFYCAFKSLHSYDSRYSFRTWLWTILLNQCRRRQQKQARWPRVGSWSNLPHEAYSLSDRSEKIDVGEIGPTARLLAKEQSQHLAALLDQLPEVQADALRLRFYGGLKFQEIADAMQCSLSSAKNRVRCGLTKMAEQMTADSLSTDSRRNPR